MDELWRGVLVQESLPIAIFLRMTTLINSNGEYARAARGGQDGCPTCDVSPDKTESHKEEHSFRPGQSSCPHGPGGLVKHGCDTCSHVATLLGLPLGMRHKVTMCPIGKNFSSYGITARAWAAGRTYNRVAAPAKQGGGLFNPARYPLITTPDPGN